MNKLNTVVSIINSIFDIDEIKKGVFANAYHLNRMRDASDTSMTNPSTNREINPPIIEENKKLIAEIATYKRTIEHMKKTYEQDKKEYHSTIKQLSDKIGELKNRQSSEGGTPEVVRLRKEVRQLKLDIECMEL
jgi:wobble nucleotide-excising tRNase